MLRYINCEDKRWYKNFMKCLKLLSQYSFIVMIYLKVWVRLLYYR